MRWCFASVARGARSRFRFGGATAEGGDACRGPGAPRARRALRASPASGRVCELLLWMVVACHCVPKWRPILRVQERRRL
jgi:hypothetical protein